MLKNTSSSQELQSNGEPSYSAVVMIKETNQANGPGHVSVSLIKENPVGIKITHTSFYPGFIGSLINGFTFGIVAVKGKLFHTPKNDFEEADHVLHTHLTHEEYKTARAAQKEFSQKVEQGSHTYSVFGELNRLSLFGSKAVTAYKSANATANQHKIITGSHPSEDHCGLEVYDNRAHRDAPPSSIYNCVSSSTFVLGGVLGLSKMHMPNQLVIELKKMPRFTSIKPEEKFSALMRSSK